MYQLYDDESLNHRSVQEILFISYPGSLNRKLSARGDFLNEILLEERL